MRRPQSQRASSSTHMPVQRQQSQSMDLGSLLLCLPIEIIEDIFIETCITDFEDLSEITTPLILGAVCNTWRAIAWSIPSLWSTIVLEISADLYDTQFELLELWLANSMSLPLSIYFSFAYPTDAIWDIYPPTNMLEKIVEHCERWRCLDICISNGREFFRILMDTICRVPLLRELNLRKYENGLLVQDPCYTFAIAPQLRSFTLSVPMSLSNIALPWSQITVFHVTESLTVEECVEVISRCPNLVECYIFPKDDDDDEESLHSSTPPSDINLPYLISLDLTNIWGFSLVPILDRISCPALRKLRLANSESAMQLETYGVGLPWKELEDFIKRSKCNLESLELEASKFEDTEIYYALQDLPTLRKLSVTQHCQNSEIETLFPSFIQDLNLDPENLDISNVLLPRLTELHYVTSCRNVVIDFKKLAEVLRRRRYAPPGMSRLSALELKIEDFSREHSVSIIMGTVLLIAEGVHFLAMMKGRRIHIKWKASYDLPVTSLRPIFSIFNSLSLG